MKNLALLPFVLVFGLTAQAAVNVQVDAAADRKPIDPRVYGVAYASTAQLLDLNVPLNRWGGNNTSRYNWQENADNRANDWYYQSVPLGPAAPAGASDAFIDDTRAGNAEPMMTVPMIGWLGKLGPNRSKLASFSWTKYQAQYGPHANCNCDWQWYDDACNGVVPGVWTYVTGNDPADASVLKDAAYQRSFVQHNTGRYGSALQGGLRYYILDNEHSIWHSTHRDVHPQGASMDEVRDKMLDYAARIREADGSALIAGPEEWGWAGYLLSGRDQKYANENGWTPPFPDRSTHGDMDYMPWLLQSLHQSDASTGGRTLDVFTLHYYPQGGEYCWPVETCGLDPDTMLRRNRSTRSLWDPDYVDETWINDKVKLIPRMKGWVAAYYPGLQTGVTEYSWGGESHMNGATAQADVLGIFGREGLDLAARWTTPAAGSPTYNAIRIYRNYDGNKSSFGDTSVRASVPDPDTLAAFAAVRPRDGALTVMVVAKALSGSASVNVNLANFAPAGSVDVWQLSGAGAAIQHLAGLSVSGGAFAATVPAPSITLFVLPAASPNRPRGDFDGDGQADILWRNAGSGQVRVTYMNGSRQRAAATFANTEPDPNWEIVGTHDFSLDGKSDVLWRNAATGALHVWAMNDTARLGVSDLTPSFVSDLNWRVVGTGDFDGDGKPDIVWRHALSGRNVVWTMNGTARIAGVYTTPDTVADNNWLIAGTSDLNADGKNDLVWRHALSGKLVTWQMNGMVRVQGLFLNPASLGDPNWKMAAVGDFSKDGQPDVVWRNAISSRSVLWEMDGTDRSYGLFTTPDVVQDANWALVGPK